MKKVTLLAILLVVVLHAAAVIVAAQQPKKIPRLGFLSLASGPAWQEEEVLQGLRDLGYVDGQNIIMDYRWAGGKVDRLPGLADELVQLKVDIIAVRATPVVQAAKKATTTIPILMLSAADPVGMGFVASLARPGVSTSVSGFENLILGT